MGAEPVRLELYGRPAGRRPSERATLLLLSVADGLRQALSTVLQQRDVTLAQYNVMRVLRDAPPEGLPTLVAGEQLIEHAPGITRMMDRLEARGWVTRTRSTEDRRQVLCSLTATARELVDALQEPMARAMESGLAGLSPAQQRQLTVLLAAL
jgi:DNA-binding MarR family transcriptional regulator